MFQPNSGGFSANENIVLRKYKKQIVAWVEATMKEEVLDMGTTVMVMQVSCQDPGCVPIETAIIIVFPKTGGKELLPNLQCSNGGSFKTKILKPMSECTESDVLDSLPPQFDGGRRTMKKLCQNARNVMLAQITQLFGSEQAEKDDRQGMALYLQQCLQRYIQNGCVPPNPEDEEDEGAETSNDKDGSTPSQPQNTTTDIASKAAETSASSSASTTTTATKIIPPKGNIVIKRTKDRDEVANGGGGNTTSTTTTLSAGNAQLPGRHAKAVNMALNSTNSIQALFNREHAPGIRQAGCPCCDPDNPSTVLENMMI